MSGSTAVIEGDVAAWKEAFASAFTQIESSNAAVVESIRTLTAAIDTIPVASTKAAAESGSAFSALTEHIVSSAEVAKLEAAGIGGAFSGLGAILGGGLAVGFLAHLLDETNKEVIALGNLSVQSGVSISSLAGLQLTARELGIDFQVVQQSMTRLEAAQARAVEGSRAQVEAFARIGLTVNEIKNLSPEELFNTVSGAIQHTGSSADIAASAITLLGRGGRALIPVFKEYGGTLDEVMKKLGEESGVTEQAYQEALKYQKVMADLGDEIRKLAIESIPYLTFGIQHLSAFLDEARAAVGELVIRSVEWVAVNRDVADALTGTKSFSEAYADIKVQAALATQSIAQLNTETAKLVNQDLGKTQEKPGDLMNWVNSLDSGKNVPSGAGAPAAKDNRLEDWKLQLQQMQDASNQSHLEMLAQEVAFWDNILQTVKLKTAEEVEIRHTIATANKEYTKQIEGDVIRSYQEAAQAAGEGTEKQIAILQTLEAYVEKTSGSQFSAEAIHAQEEITKAKNAAAENEIKNLSKIASMNEEIAAQEAKRATLQVQEAVKDQQAQIIEQKDQQIKPTGTIGAVVDASQLQARSSQQIAIAQSAASQEEAISEQLRDKQIADAEVVENANTQAFAAGTISLQQYQEEHDRIEGEITKFIQQQATEREEINKKLNDQMDKADEQEAKKMMQIQEQLTNSFAAAFDKMIFQSKNAGQALRDLWQGIVKAIIEQFVKMATQFIIQQTVMNAIAKALAAQKLATAMAADEAEHVTTVAANELQVQSYAGVAAAAAFAANAEDPVAAAVAATAAFAATEAFGSAAAAERGYDVPGKSGVYPTFLHPREMVLPSDIAGGVRSMVNNSTSNTSAAGQTFNVRQVFAPTINTPFNPEEHADKLFSMFRGKLRKLGVSA